MKRDVLIICNPVAGGGSAQRRIGRLVEILRRQGHRAETFFTRAPGDAKRRARCIGPGVTTLGVAGGDGTVNEVLNGLPDPTRIPTVLLPTGTANMLARELGLPSKPEAVAEVIERGSVRKLDMGLVDDRRFLMVLSSGFDAMVTEQIELRGRRPAGYCSYLPPVLKTLVDYRSPELTVAVDGREGLEGGLVVVSNTRNYGGIFTVAERARCDSGHLDACIFQGCTIGGLMRCAVAALARRASKLPGVT
ncbi:MAG: diacylglycerol/lipid kinase family protein, partial [Syntrophobacteria bacterium]